MYITKRIPQNTHHVDTVRCTQDMHLDITCAPHAQMDLLVEHHSGTITCSITLERESRISINFVGNISSASAITCSVQLQGVGAQAFINGAYIVQEGQTFISKTEQYHQAPHTTSNLHMRKIVYDAAHARYNGMIHIAGSATQTDASQQDKTLLIGDTAHAESIPSIEVKTNDVQCAHGSALGRLNDEQLYYMHARGLPTQKASTLLLNGFLRAVVDTIEHTQLRSQAAAYLGIHYE